MTNARTSTLERAFEIARLGECETKLQMIKQLNREGYTDAKWQLEGRTLWGQLAALIAHSRRKSS